MLQVLTGGALGQVVAGNVGGFIVGSFITDVLKTAKIQYADRQLENGDEAARRLKYNIKQAEEKKPEEKEKAEEKQDKLKKAEELQEEDKKAEKKEEIERKVEEKIREIEKKTEDQKKQEKKAEEQIEKEKKAEEVREKQKKAEEMKEREKKAEQKKDTEKKALLIINDSTITPPITETGAKVEASINYTLLGPESLKSRSITETRVLTNKRKSFELDKRERSREQGTYSSTVKFTVSDEMPTGSCTLYTTISDGEYTKTVKSEVIINQ
ncbi:MAG: hypothetical protein L6290_09070 [Thermodesulfovibrionales bacterium]|nr:hypothetical protein [Thermodesulfovibrionales bacterium]